MSFLNQKKKSGGCRDNVCSIFLFGFFLNNFCIHIFAQFVFVCGGLGTFGVDGMEIKNNNLHIWIADYPICILIHIYACFKNIKSQREWKALKRFSSGFYLKDKTKNQTNITNSICSEKQYEKIWKKNFFLQFLSFFPPWFFMCVKYHNHLIYAQCIYYTSDISMKNNLKHLRYVLLC